MSHPMSVPFPLTPSCVSALLSLLRREAAGLGPPCSDVCACALWLCLPHAAPLPWTPGSWTPASAPPEPPAPAPGFWEIAHGASLELPGAVGRQAGGFPSGCSHPAALLYTARSNIYRGISLPSRPVLPLLPAPGSLLTLPWLPPRTGSILPRLLPITTSPLGTGNRLTSIPAPTAFAA